MKNQNNTRLPRGRKAATKDLKAKLVQNNNFDSNVKREFAPVALGRVRRSQRPKVRSLGDGGDVIISHREYINDIAGSVAFSSNTFAVNPGLPETFPWLASIASRFESYVFDSICFKFETEKSTSTNGSVLGAIDYDASDIAPVNKTQIMSYRHATRSQTWEDFDMSALAEDLHKRKSYFVRIGSLAANQDVKLYDTGNFFICTQGQADTTLVGELYVEYIVRLMTPQLGIPGLGTALYGTFSGTSNAAPYSTVVGNLPVTGPSSTGTTTSLTTWTFTQPWVGICSMEVTGTGLAGGVTAAGTATTASTYMGIVNSGSANSVWCFSIDAQVGQTFIITNNNTTISSAIAVFAQGLANF